MKVHLLLLLLLPSTILAGEDSINFPSAVLYIDGKPHKIDSGTSCWGDMCDDVFGSRTSSKPLLVKDASKVEIEFQSKSKLIEAYVSTTGIFFMDREAEEWSKDSVVWRVKERYAELFEGLEEFSKRELKNTLRQELPMDIEAGEYVLDFSTWWEHGDAYYSVYIWKE